MSDSYSFLSALLAQKQQAYGKALEYAVAAALLDVRVTSAPPGLVQLQERW